MQRPESPAASQEEGPKKDKVYRRYASNVERALSLFDTALQEWADYIAFLGRLLKALQSKPTSTSDIPHTTIVAKRLAQCLAPVLPSGVHQKALEVYAYVFAVLGKAGLARDLSLWLPGIAPTLSSASLSVKPLVLSLFETFIVPLEAKTLRPALKGILLALLPGLDEESSEEYERTLRLLGTLRAAVSRNDDEPSATHEYTGEQYLWQALFLAGITSPSRRQGVLAYLSKELPAFGKAATHHDPQGRATLDRSGESKIEIDAVTSPEPGLLIRCFAAGLQDEQLLIQRGFLDLLVSHLPLHSAILRQRVVPKDLELLVTAASSVVARREMSLNRRLWTWLLGPQSSTPADGVDTFSPTSPISNGNPPALSDSNLPQSQYFQRYGLEPLVSGILQMTANDSLAPIEKARPFRICLSLMDRWEIGGLVMPRVFLPAMQSIWRYQKQTAVPADAFAEVYRSATVFFDGVESSLIWAKFNELIAKALGIVRVSRADTYMTDTAHEFDLVLFILSKFNVGEEEMTSTFIPLSLLALLIRLRFNLETNALQDGALAKAYDIANALIDLVSHHTLNDNESTQSTSPNTGRQTLTEIETFFNTSQNGSRGMNPPSVDGAVGAAIRENASLMVAMAIESLPLQIEHFEKSIHLLDKVLRRSEDSDMSVCDKILSSFMIRMERLNTDTQSLPFPILGAITSLLETINQTNPTVNLEDNYRTRRILPKLFTMIWKYTSPSTPKYNVEAVRCLWRIHSIASEPQFVEGLLSTLIYHDPDGNQAQTITLEGARRFATLWVHSTSGSLSPANRHLSVGSIDHKMGKRIASSRVDPFILSRPLLLLLDSLQDPKTQVSRFVQRWLGSLASLQRYEVRQSDKIPSIFSCCIQGSRYSRFRT